MKAVVDPLARDDSALRLTRASGPDASATFHHQDVMGKVRFTP